MPSLAERKPSAEQAATVVRLRAELEDAQKARRPAAQAPRADQLRRSSTS